MIGSAQIHRRLRFGSFRTNYDAQKELIGQSVAALSVGSDVELFRDIEGVIEFDAEVADGAFHLGMSEQQLDRP